MKGVFYITFFKKLRLSKPWRYKFPLLLSFTYIFFLIDVIPFKQLLIFFFCSIVTTLGFAGIGYLTNDLSDMKADLVAGKSNGTAQLSRGQIVFASCIFLLMALVPWVIFPLDEVSISFIIVELMLFLLYAFPPIRLKEKGVWGLIADAGYAHVIPSMLAIWTFYLASDKSLDDLPVLLLIVGGWQLFSGIRNILSHQIADFNFDVKSGTKTVVTNIGLERSNEWMIRFLIPVELFGATLFVVYLSQYIWYFWIITLFHLLINTYRYAKPHDNSKVKQFTNFILDEFYIKWIPLIILLHATLVSYPIGIILLLHILLFTRWESVLKFMNK